ncbi:glycosyltransferase family A protein [Rhizobium sp. FY34]|uniref:glycosyltransferase family A protein n=1 Tax=Rhizobium sp. FY34 TaxID=2562309 RepID=UPI0010C071CB|nr:glycosyltransferase family A protein [Rhizobium sp. FY34]
MATFTVIIPFYQRDAGVLLRALRSIFAQSFSDYDILVVDDASPYPGERELEELSDEERSRVRLIKQANAGPGGARNTGLDNVPAETRFVAFLDSDDIWLPTHLENAHKSLTRLDGDCYWASMQADEDFYYHFGMAKLEEEDGARRVLEAPLVLEVPDLASVMLKNWSFLHLSCMVIARPIFEKVRFEPLLRLAAEDVLFFCDCILAARHPLLCDDAGATRGRGINIFHGIDNLSPQFLRQQFNTWVALDRLELRFARRPDAIASINAYKNTARRQALWSQAGLMRRRRVPDLSMLAQWAWRDPALFRTAFELGAGKLKPRDSASAAST